MKRKIGKQLEIPNKRVNKSRDNIGHITHISLTSETTKQEANILLSVIQISGKFQLGCRW